MDLIETDVLIAGAGLAGLRAALSARASCPGARVLVLDARTTPAGSSFANLNDALGILAPADTASREAFLRTAQTIAAPGEICPQLVRVLADEAYERSAGLLESGVIFERNADGSLARFGCCFMPETRAALVFRGLARTGRILTGRVRASGADLLRGVALLDFVRPDAAGPVLGGLIATAGGLVAVRAGAVIAAAGGAAGLFGHSIAGPGGDGGLAARLVRAGARVVNPGYFQFMWHELPGPRFFDFSLLADPDVRVVEPETGREIPVPPELRELVPQRLRHCPLGHGLDDAALDFFLVGKLHGQGSAEIVAPGRGRIRIMPFAQAANTGVRIDPDGWTGVSGLFAAGECAAGMHGANRVGGAMIAATQVFGARAGEAAARYAGGCPVRGADGFREAAGELAGTRRTDAAEYRRGRAWLRAGLTARRLRDAGEGFAANVERRLDVTGDSRLRDLFETALLLGASHSFSRKGK